jgi:hypothetical protein
MDAQIGGCITLQLHRWGDTKIALYYINQGSTETNQQQPTDIAKKITNAHEQHKLPNNLMWTRVIRKGKQFLSIAIHQYVSIIKSDRTLIITLLCKVTLVFFSGYHDIHWAFKALLKLEKKILQQTSWAGWQHPDDKWSENIGFNI